MSTEPLESLDSELDGLLESERRAEPPADALSRVWSRVAIAPLPTKPGTLESPAGSNAPVRYRWLASHASGVAAATFLLGGAAGAILHATLEKPTPPRVVYLESPAAPPAPAPPETRNPEAPRPSPPSLPATAPAPPQATASASTSLSAERALIDRARADLASGNAQGALSRLELHAHRFPKPQLSEEREALVIQSLVTLGRYDEARAVAARFKATNPGSLFLPAIEASLGSIP
jgi:hypothetical protein